MKNEQVLEIYDRTYAEGYDRRFLLDECRELRVNSEVEILRVLLGEKRGATRWLDVACGTGYHLSLFPEAGSRAGLDISPEMLNVARRAAPEARFVQGDFRNRSLMPEGQWDVVSSMWWAYCLVESMADIEQLVSNMATWLTDDGVCLLPIGDPIRNILGSKVTVPYVANADEPASYGRMLITGFTWTWIEGNGTRHENMVLPVPEHLIEIFGRHFVQVETVPYAHSYRAILATRRSKSFEHIRTRMADLEVAHAKAGQAGTTVPEHSF